MSHVIKTKGNLTILKRNFLVANDMRNHLIAADSPCRAS